MPGSKTEISYLHYIIYFIFSLFWLIIVIYWHVSLNHIKLWLQIGLLFKALSIPTGLFNARLQINDRDFVMVKNALLPYVRSEKNRTDFSEMLIWLFMQNAQFEMALRQAKALDKRTNADGEGVYDLAESFLDKKYYNLAVKAYDYVLEKGPRNFLFVEANINKLYALTKSLSEQKKEISVLDKAYQQVLEE
jgi:tetratricopeptide (TPR) repeat protein